MRLTLLGLLPLLTAGPLGCSDVSNDALGMNWLPPVAGASGGGSGGGAGAATGAGTAGLAGSAGQGGASGGASVAGSAGVSGGGTELGGAAGNAGSGGGGAGGMPSEGQALYDANCKLCHGLQGVGSPVGPELQHPVRDYARWVVRNGRAPSSYPKPMDKWGTDKLSDEQLSLVLDYLSEPPQPTSAQALFLDYCGNCHGADAKGGPTGRNLLNEVDKVEALVRSGKNGGQFQLRRDFMPAFSADTLSDSEVSMIRDYIDSL